MTRYLLPVQTLIPGSCRIISPQSVPQLLYLYAVLLLSSQMSEMAFKHSPLLKVIHAYLQLIKKHSKDVQSTSLLLPSCALQTAELALDKQENVPSHLLQSFLLVYTSSHPCRDPDYPPVAIVVMPETQQNALSRISHSLMWELDTCKTNQSLLIILIISLSITLMQHG